ncbi:MAG: 5-formyltetrahydrofolate cyclo-ligase [Pseudomonadales bacterium]|jgi:5-formyltetrahydrofolate cyclo-ligase|nr:5-formyltetrahydrofolate cyclo-ligase [Pseudomonadales bacterium]
MNQPPSMPANAERRRLRRVMRARRRALDARAQRRAAAGLAEVLSCALRHPWPHRIAFYLARDGEIDPDLTVTPLAERGCSLFLPRIDPLRGGSDRLRFTPFEPAMAMRRNRLGIPEPDTSHTVPPWTLDVVLMPLVAFDRRGGRLGMGGGFYDRSFSALRPRPRQPLLIGIAHSIQEVERVPTAQHDVPLDGIATERDVHWVSQRVTRRSAARRKGPRS